MIAGIGIDIIEIERIKNILEKNPNFLNKIFTKNEIEYLKRKNMRPEFAAGKFAAKEAVAKALGTGFREFSFNDIEIDKNVLGKPIVVLKGKAKKMDKKWNEYKIHLSISHSKHNAVAYAILEVLDDENCYITSDETD